VRTGITQQVWIRVATEFETAFCAWIGKAEHFKRVCERGG